MTLCNNPIRDLIINCRINTTQNTHDTKIIVWDLDGELSLNIGDNISSRSKLIINSSFVTNFEDGENKELQSEFILYV